MEPLLPGKAFDGFQGMPSHLKKLAPVEPFNGAVDHRREDPMKGALVAVVANLAEGRHGNAQLFLELPAYRILGGFAIFDVPPGRPQWVRLKLRTPEWTTMRKSSPERRMQRAVRKRGADRRKKSRLTETLNCKRNLSIRRRDDPFLNP